MVKRRRLKRERRGEERGRERGRREKESRKREKGITLSGYRMFQLLRKINSDRFPLRFPLPLSPSSPPPVFLQQLAFSYGVPPSPSIRANHPLSVIVKRKINFGFVLSFRYSFLSLSLSSFCLLYFIYRRCFYFLFFFRPTDILNRYFPSPFVVSLCYRFFFFLKPRSLLSPFSFNFCVTQTFRKP